MSPPAEVDGARVLYWADLRRSAPTGKTRYVVDGEQLRGAFAFLAICSYEDSEEVYLFRMDAAHVVLADTLHDSVGEALAQSAFEFDNLEFQNIRNA